MVCVKTWSNEDIPYGPRYINHYFGFSVIFGMWIKSEGELYCFLNHFTLYQG